MNLVGGTEDHSSPDVQMTLLESWTSLSISCHSLIGDHRIMPLSLNPSIYFNGSKYFQGFATDCIEKVYKNI